MAEYIEREAALVEVCHYCSTKEDCFPNERCLDYELVNTIPAADVAPVRHGRWIWDDEGYHCSECFYHAYGETGEVLSGHWHYCPNCGAKMEET